MSKKLIIVGLIISLILSIHINVFAEDNSQAEIILNGTKIQTKAYTRDGEVYFPVKQLSEALGYTVLLSEENQTISISKDDKNIMIKPKEYEVTVNDHSYMNYDLVTVEDITYMNSDFFSDNLGLRYQWDKENESLIIESVKENSIYIKTVKEAYNDDKIDVDLQYPELAGLDNKDVQDSLNSIFKKFAEYAKNEGLKNAEEVYGVHKYQTNFDYSIKYNQNGLISLIFKDYQYTGGAHGLTIQSSHTFNLNTGEEYKIKDLMNSDADYVTFISDIVKEKIAERKLPLLAPFESIKQDEDFYLSNSGVVVYFQQYEYFPYAAGIQKFTTEFSQLKDMLKPEFSFLNYEVK